MRRIFTTPILITVLLVLSGCVAQKKKGGEDVTGFKKFYQDTTSEFNYYFNGGVLLDETMAAMTSEHTENYNQVLPMWKYTEIDNPQGHAENLDKIREKMTVMISLHRGSHWVDDGYLMMAKADYLKKDYESAQETLLYIADEFSPSAMRKKNAAKNRKKNSKKKGGGVDKDGKKKLTKKQRQKLAKKKKKERDKERKRKKKEIAKRKKMKKKGKKLPPKTATAKKDDPKKDDKAKEIDEDDIAAPTSIRLGNLEPEVEEGKPDSYFLKHRPAYQEVILWLARTYIERDNYTMAQRMIDKLGESTTTFEDIRAQLAEVKAHFYLNQKKYKQALPGLNEIIALSKDKKLKARASFMIGQINQRLENSTEAAVAYERVLKFKPNYEMDFNARLKLATTAWKTGQGTAAAAKRELQKMLKDIKNEEFRDAIYFALADIALSENDRPLAINYLKKSAWSSLKNVNQKTESYLLLADLYYEDEDYVNAKSYYDSTSQLMPKFDERWVRVNDLNSNLTEIAANIVIVDTQDSLLRISLLPDDEKAKIAARIKKQRDEEKLAKIAAEAKKQEMLARVNSRGSIGGLGGLQEAVTKNEGGITAIGQQGASSFFAYKDAGSIKREMRDFERQWGSRDLSDNWRRASASTFGRTEEEEEEAVAENLTEDDISKILAGLPETPEQKAQANKQIEDALFELGGLFRDRLKNYEKSAERLEDLLQRYPDTEYQLDAYYMLYLCYKELNNSAKAKLYADRIINEYPNSTYAKLIQDPSYIKEILSDERKLQVYYEETYDAFTKGQYQVANERITQVSTQFGAKNKLQPRFALLNAMVAGNLQGRDTYINMLKEVIAQYPETPEQIRARDMLKLLGGSKASGPGQNRPALEELDGESPFKMEEGKLHYMLVVLDKEVNMNDAKVGVSDYNRKYHKLDKLRISNIYLGGVEEKIPMIVIRRFKKKEDAMTYYDGVSKNSGDFLPGFNYTVYPVTQNNYRTILKEKSLAGYDAFFQTHYE